MLTTGTLFILITGLFINGGAGGAFSAEEAFAGPNAIVMNTVISSATSGLTYMLANQISNLRIDNSLIQQTGLIQNYNISQLCNAILAGLVSSTACCNNIQLWQSALVGLMSCLIY